MRRRFLVPLDYSEPSLRALEYGLALAKPLGASVTVFHAYGGSPATQHTADQREHAERLDKLVSRRRGSSVELTGMVRWSTPSDGIHYVAEEIDAELVIMGTHGRRGVQRALLGSVTESVLRDSTRPIVTIPPAHEDARHRGLPARILAATDCSDTSEPALGYALELAALIGSSVTVLHAHTSARTLDAARARLERVVAGCKRRGVTIDAALREDEPERAINDVASAIDADLIILGTRGRQGIARAFAGSVAEKVIRAATRPVLALRTSALRQ